MIYHKMFWPKRIVYFGAASTERGGGGRGGAREAGGDRNPDFNDVAQPNTIRNIPLDMTIEEVKKKVAEFKMSPEQSAAIKRMFHLDQRAKSGGKTRGAAGPAESADLPQQIETIKADIIKTREQVHAAMEQLLNGTAGEEIVRKSGEVIVGAVRSAVQQALKSCAERVKEEIKSNPDLAAIYDQFAPLVDSIAEGVDLEIEDGKIKIVKIRKTVRLGGDASVTGQYSPGNSYVQLDMYGNSLTLDSRRQVILDAEEYGKLTLSPQSVVYHQAFPGDAGGVDAAIGFGGQVEVRGVLNTPDGPQVAVAYSGRDGRFYLQGNIPVSILGGEAMLAVNAYGRGNERGGNASLVGVF